MFEQLYNALNASGIPFAKYAWNNAPHEGSYGVIALDDESRALWADGKQLEQAMQGTVDLFCRGTASRTAKDLVQSILKAQGVSWQLNSIQVEREKHVIHYEWLFELEVE